MNNIKEVSYKNSNIIIAQIYNQTFGFFVNSITEINNLPPLTLVPMCPDYIAGIFNLQGSVVTVLDLKKYLKFEPNDNQAPKMQIIFECNQNYYSIIINEIIEIIEKNHTLVDLPENIQTHLTDIANGVYKWHDNNIVVIDVEKLVISLQSKAVLQ